MHTQLRIKNLHSCDFFSLYHLHMGSGRSTCVLAVEVRASSERLQSSCSENHLRVGGSCNQDFLQTSVALRRGHSGLYLLSPLKKSKTNTKKKKSHKRYILRSADILVKSSEATCSKASRFFLPSSQYALSVEL